MYNNITSLTGILSITQIGGVRLLRGANNATTPLTPFQPSPTVVTVFKHIERFQPSLTSSRELYPNRDFKKKPLSNEEALLASILDYVYDTFGSTKGVSFKFQTSDGETTIQKSF